MESQLSQKSKKIIEAVVPAAATASILEPDDKRSESYYSASSSDYWTCSSPSSVSPPTYTYNGSLEESVGSSPSPTDDIFQLLDDGDSSSHAKKRPFITYNFFPVTNCCESFRSPLTNNFKGSGFPATIGEEAEDDDEKHLPIKKRRRFLQFNK